MRASKEDIERQTSIGKTHILYEGASYFIYIEDEELEARKKALRIVDANKKEYTEEFDLSSYSDCYIMTKKYALFVEEREKRRLEKEAKKERHAAICKYLSLGEMSTL